MATENMSRESTPTDTGQTSQGTCPECRAPLEFACNSICPGEDETKSTYRCTNPDCRHEVSCAIGSHP